MPLAPNLPTPYIASYTTHIWFESQWASSQYTLHDGIQLVRARCAQYGHVTPTDDSIHTRWTTPETMHTVYEMTAIPHSIIEQAVEATGADDAEP